MDVDHLYVLLLATFIGLFLAGAGILSDGFLGAGLRRGMAFFGCCVILVSVVAL